MTFKNEAAFEDAVIDALIQHGWDGGVLMHPTEQVLLDNWAKILFDNNRSVDRLGDVALTTSEMAQIMEQVVSLRTPLKLNEFINGRTVSVKRDAPASPNFGKEISLKIYDRMEIAGGQSRYQIARQPSYSTPNAILPDRRGDLMLLINGMPVIHIELKRSGVPVSQAYNQIAKYAHEGVYQGLFSLVQVFVAMNPEETLYFANPGPDGTFNPDFYFHWADFNNEPINDWQRVVGSLLSIPMAHQLIGFYTVADRAAGVLMVMRSYQYFAANQIAGRVMKKVWGDGEQRGGYVWHTTGSGKTITSFKTAQLIADSRVADKVVFLLDRIELGTQSLANYRSYGGEAIDVEDTDNSAALLDKLKDSESVLLVTSIQKMSRLSEEEGTRAADIAAIRKKKVVFVVDEAHRSTFGDMMRVIKKTLPDAFFFGFTGTPIHDENRKRASTTSTLFGDELHRYSIADGIQDGNVLGFDPVMVQTFAEGDLRREVALRQADANDETDAYGDPRKAKIFDRLMDTKATPMAGTYVLGKHVKGIEEYVPSGQWTSERHREAVAGHIVKNWPSLSRAGMFHAILATSSIPEAIAYFRLFRDKYPQLAVSALFDPNIDNTGQAQLDKEDGLVEILKDYNQRYGRNLTVPTHDQFKADVSARLAHKRPYNAKTMPKAQQLDLLIVVDQMLTGFDSKWLNTLYLDKVLEYESVIQAFSRTNRIYGPEKPFGSIRYYRKPHTMRANIERAVALYSGDREFGLFVEQLDAHLDEINRHFEAIEKLFTGIADFATLPVSEADRGEFAKRFSQLYQELQAAFVQGFTWSVTTYTFENPHRSIDVRLDEASYYALVARYKELPQSQPGTSTERAPFDINTHITHVDTGRIDSDYLNAKFAKYVRGLQEGVPESELAMLLQEVHASFARLSSQDQVYANLWLNDVASGQAKLASGKTVEDYINDYKLSHQDRQITQLVGAVGIDESLLRAILDAHVNAGNIDEYARFTKLKSSVDLDRAKAYLEARDGKPTPVFQLRVQVEKLLRAFILHEELPADLEKQIASAAGQKSGE